MLIAWPNMPVMHRPDFQAFADHNKSIIYRDSYIWPYINQEKLLTTKTLPMLLNSRNRHHPSNFTAVDFGATNMGRCCTQLLHDIPESTLTSDSFPVLPEPPLKPESEISGFESLGVMAAEAPYRVPAQLDLGLVESLLATKASTAEDHETLKDLDGNIHPLMNRDRSELWAHIIGSVVSKAYLDLELFSEVSSQAKKLVSLQKQYADEISPSRGLPEEYLHTLLRFHCYLHLGATEPLSNLQCGVAASPPLRKYFARLPPDAQSTDISVVLKCRYKMGKVENRVLWLLCTLSKNSSCLALVGMPLIVDELERLLQSDPRARDLLSSYVTMVLGDISIISRCLHQLEIYYPWAREFAIELSNREENFEQDYVEWTKSWAQILEGLRDTTVLTRAARLGDPSGGKFTYPVERRRTKESVAALRNAEAHLDAFWADNDRVMVSFSDQSSSMAVRSLLSQQRILKRTT
ncbi:hypothetical protein N7536_003068 [Penicillium majusculum]|nr:hypothetical protein N7536_003068 [Penicillium majusculum]